MTGDGSVHECSYFPDLRKPYMTIVHYSESGLCMCDENVPAWGIESRKSCLGAFAVPLLLYPSVKVIKCLVMSSGNILYDR
jgi:hypothetical protein